MAGITLEPTGSADLERCDCCGTHSRTVWGFARRDEDAHAYYLVHWTVGHVATYGAHFDLVLGEWGDGTSAVDRCAVSVEFRQTADGPGFMIRDAVNRPVATSGLA